MQFLLYFSFYALKIFWFFTYFHYNCEKEDFKINFSEF